MWAVPQATEYLQKIASYFFKKCTGNPACLCFILFTCKKDFTGKEKLFSVMNFHWLTNLHTAPFPPETSNTSHWTYVGRHWDRQNFGIVLSFITSVCLPWRLAKHASRCIALVNLQSKWSLHETPPQFVNSWTACSRNERREYTHMPDLRWFWPHQEFLVSKTVLCWFQWLCCPRRLSEAAWFWDREFASNSGHGRSLLL